MAAYALLIGTTGKKRELLADGDPREVRSLFKGMDVEPFDCIEVIDTRIGRDRRKRNKGNTTKKTAKKATKISD